MGNNITNIFDSGDIAEISALIDKLEKSSFDYLKLESDGLRIIIGKNGAGENPGADAAAPHRASENVRELNVGNAAAADSAIIAPPAASVPEPAEKTDILEQDGIVVVKSPNYGLFYMQSEPGAPPYVTVGATVKAGDTVGLLETMKTFTAISSPADGKVIAIHVKNEETLEPDQPLVSIKI